MGIIERTRIREGSRWLKASSHAEMLTTFELQSGTPSLLG